MNEHDSLHAAIYEIGKLYDHDASWPAAFLVERERLISLFPAQFVEVAHIGSTAIPGLKAKPIIDIMAGVKSMAVAEALAEPLCQSGYTTSVEFNKTLGDRKWFMRWANGRRTHHLHVVVHGAKPWSERIRFRDTLRQQPELAARYAALKSQLAETHPTDREAYTDAKTEFIRAVLSDT